MGLERKIEEVPDRQAKFQQKENGDRDQELLLRIRAFIKENQQKGGKCKIINKPPDQEPGHSQEANFKIPEVFHEDGTNGNIGEIQNNQ
jgi:hypothetical protein